MNVCVPLMMTPGGGDGVHSGHHGGDGDADGNHDGDGDDGEARERRERGLGCGFQKRQEERNDGDGEPQRGVRGGAGEARNRRRGGGAAAAARAEGNVVQQAGRDEPRGARPRDLTGGAGADLQGDELDFLFYHRVPIVLVESMTSSFRARKTRVDKYQSIV